MSFLYFILLLFTLIAIAVAVASLTMKEWCAYHCISMLSTIGLLLGDKSFDPSSVNPYLVSTFKYKKRVADAVKEANSETDCCAVCLSGFEDDDDVKQLPHCKHLFHAPCIDMWLNSHSNCPVCRAPVDRLASNNRPLALQGNSQYGEVALNISISA